MLDRLMRRPVFAEPDRVVRHHMDDALAHQRGEPDRRPAIIGKHQEGARIGNDAAMQRHAVHGRRHAVLAHAVVNEAAGIVGGVQRLHRLGARVVGAGEIGGTADHFRQRRRQGFERKFGSGARRDVLGRCREFLFHLGDTAPPSASFDVAAHAALELGARLGISGGKAHLPSEPHWACRARRPRAKARGCRSEFRRVARSSRASARAPAISSAPSAEPWLFSLPALFGAPKPMVVRQAIIEGRSRRLRGFDRRCNRRRIVAVDAGRRPAGGLETLHLIDRVGKRERAVDRDAVVVEQHDELVELEMAGERDRFLADAFHQVAIGREHIGRVIDDIAAEHRGEVTLGDRHADRIGKTLAERTGRGLDAGRVAVFGMAGRERAELAEILDLRRSSSSRSREDAGARRSASIRGRPKARSDRDRARPDRSDRISGSG